MYLWPFIENNQRNRNVGTTDGVARKYDEYLHRDNLDTHVCKVFYDRVCEYPHCTEGETVINCRVVPNSSYNQVGETIIGDLKI